MKLFDYENYTLSLATPELLLIPEFSKVLSEYNEEKAFSIFTYIFLYLDWKSPFVNFEEKDRKLEALTASNLKEEDIEDIIVKNAIEKYNQILESDLTIVMINAMKNSIHKYKKYFNEIDFTEKVESGPRKGSLVYSVNEYNKAMKDGDQIFETIERLETALKKKLKESTNTRENTIEEGLDY